MDRRYTSRNEIGQGVLELKPQVGEWAVYPRHNMSEFVVLGGAIDCLAAYEETGLNPEEVEALKIDNDRLHRLIDELENGLRKENNNA